MGEAKHNPTAILAKKGLIEPKPPKRSKRQQEREVQALIYEKLFGFENMRRNKMNDVYYVDKRTMTIVKNLDTSYMAPEMYYKYRRGSEGIVKEKWMCTNGMFLDFAYSILDIGTGKLPDKRDAHFAPDLRTLPRCQVAAHQV